MTTVSASVQYSSDARRARSMLQAVVLAVAVLATLAGVFFRTHNPGAKTFWGDELVGLTHTLGYTEAEIVRAGPQVRTAADIQVYFNLAGPQNSGPRPLRATVASLASEDPQHPPVFYLMQRLWAGVAGVSPTALRTLPIIFGLLTIGAMAWLALELFQSRRAALIAASLYAISPFAVLYAQEARETTLWTLEIVTASVLLLRAARTAGTGSWVAYAVVCTLSLYTYPLSATVMAAHFALVISIPSLRQRRVLLPYVIASAVATLLFLPWPLLSNTHAGAKALGVLLANEQTPLGLVVTFLRDIKASMIDLGAVEPGSLSRLTSMALGTAVLAVVLASIGRLAVASRDRVAERFILALFVIPTLPIALINGGALISQLRYLAPAFLATQLALTALFCASFPTERRARGSAIVFAATYVLIVAFGVLSCVISAGADTWYPKAWQRSPHVAAIINQAPRPLVVGDETVSNDRGTSRVLEIAYSLDPNIAMRVNLHCEACLIEAPPRRDVLADAGQFRTVFVLGVLKRPIPRGDYEVRQVGVDIDPAGRGPLEMFAPYPR
ncbi:MAG: glycosyltransferase family 39 protein [Proteobacteria bacterium]|nr:glycosyltransferase family 39 protein [Pseudomonadota bacterium]